MAAARVSIPAGVRRMIQDIKEIAGAHADEEVYAVLRECDMDPNEATQRLLSRGTFHEVKRKRDKKKESRKESADPRLRPGVQGRDIKGGQANCSARVFSNLNDLGGRKPLSGKEIGVNPNIDKANSIFANRNMESKASTSSSSLSGYLCNGPSQHVAPIEKKYPAIGHLPISDLKQAADLEGVEDVTTSVLGLNQSIKLHTADPIPSLSLEACSHGEICSTEHDLGNKQTAGVLEAWNPILTSKPTQAENVMFEDVPIKVGTVTLSVPVLNSARKEDSSLKMDKKVTEMQQCDKQYVIIPYHLQLTESEKYGLSFGSFGTSFDQKNSKGTECEKSSISPEDDSSQELHEIVCEATISHQGASSNVSVEAHNGLQQLSINDSSPQRVYGSSDTPRVGGSDITKYSSEAPLQDSVAQTTKDTDQTQVPETLGSQVLRANDISESHHKQLKQPITDDGHSSKRITDDGHITHFAAPAVPMKDGNILVSHAQSGEAQEGMNSNSFVVPAPGSAPFVPAVSVVAPSSIAIPQPPVPLFRQPVGVPLPHYGPGFIPYNHYISPFYYPPHTLNHLMSNAAVFLQSPSTGNLYQPVSTSVAPLVKYSSGAYKTDDNCGGQTHVGIPGPYAVYGSSPSVYTNNAVVMNGTSVETDEVTGSQFKENNVLTVGQQDVSSLQPAPFSGLPSQGQHLAFVPPQAGHGAFRGMYHPSQTLGGPVFHPLQSSQTTAGAVERVGLPASAHQQPQHAQMNWGSY